MKTEAFRSGFYIAIHFADAAKLLKQIRVRPEPENSPKCQ